MNRKRPVTRTPRLPRSSRRLGPLLAALLAAACYRTTPVTTPSPDSGVQLVVDLTDAGSVQLAPKLGTRIESVRGTVADETETGLLLLLQATVNRTGSEARWQGERVEIPRDYIASMRERRFDKGRSILLAALLVGGVIAAGGILGGGSGFSGFLGGGGGSRQ